MNFLAFVFFILQERHGPLFHLWSFSAVQLIKVKRIFGLPLSGALNHSPKAVITKLKDMDAGTFTQNLL